jgi:fibronectin type 3 domain-containing protein
MRSSVMSVVGVGLILVSAGCRTRERIPDYLPREVVANQVGNAVVYETNDPRHNTVVNAPVQAPSPEVHAPVVPVPVAAAPVVVAPVATTGGPVAEADGVPKRRTLYGQPEGVAVSDGGLREATLTWTAPADEVYRYRIERSESPTGPFAPIDEVAPRKIQYRDRGSESLSLKDKTAYYYQIVAILDKDGPESIASKVVKTITAPPPAAPGGVTATAPSSRAVKITWASSPSPAVSLYRVERAPAGSDNFERVGSVPVPLFVDGGTAASSLRDSTPYRYRVITINRVNAESVPSIPVEVTTLPPPARVQKLTVVTDEVRCVPLSWAPSPESDVVRYEIFRSRLVTGSFEKIGSVPGRLSVTFLDGGANPGNLEDEADYYYKIRAINAVTAESADSETVKATTRGVPTEVGTITLTGNRPREIPIAWPVNADKAVMGYEIWRADENSEEWVQVGRVVGRETAVYLDRGEIKPKPGLGSLKDGTVYQYKVIAFNTAGVRSSASQASSARTKYRPVTPAGLVATTNMPLSIRMTWKSNPEKDISDYVVECADEPDSGSFKKLVSVSPLKEGELSARETALESGVNRYYRIKAIDKDGLESDWCVPESGRSKPIPGMPLSVAAESVGTNVRATWQAPAQPDIRRYKVWRKKFIGWDLISTTDQTNYLFEYTELSKPMKIAISSVDQDELESEKTEIVEIKPGL